MNLTPDAESRFRLQDYGKQPGIDGVSIVELRRFNDDGGSMVELVRLSDATCAELDGFRPAQINYSSVQPGAIKAFHVHRKQTDVWFVRPEDRMLLVLVDVREGSPASNRPMRILLGDGNARLVRIPPGVAHGCRNLGNQPASIIYLTDLHFSPDPAACDEGRLPWDLAGQDVWDVSRE